MKVYNIVPCSSCRSEYNVQYFICTCHCSTYFGWKEESIVWKANEAARNNENFGDCKKGRIRHKNFSKKSFSVKIKIRVFFQKCTFTYLLYFYFSLIFITTTKYRMTYSMSPIINNNLYCHTSIKINLKNEFVYRNICEDYLGTLNYNNQIFLRHISL